jgi:spore coat protein U-like protein
MLKKVTLLAALGCALVSSNASAAQITSNLNITAQITGSCTLSTAAALDFGSIASTNTAATLATQSVAVDCSTGVPFAFGMSYGANPFAITRRMASGVNLMTYEVFMDAARTQSFEPIGQTNNISGTGTGASQNFTVYGRIPVQTTPPSGSYSDVLVVTLQY